MGGASALRAPRAWAGNRGRPPWRDRPLILPQAEAALGPIDVLVNNAGVQVIERWEKTDLARAEASLRTNLVTPMRLTHAVLPAMLARRSGSIVDVSSVAALGPTPYAAWYSASKGGLAAASEALHGELRGTGVTVLTGPRAHADGRRGRGLLRRRRGDALDPLGHHRRAGGADPQRGRARVGAAGLPAALLDLALVPRDRAVAARPGHSRAEAKGLTVEHLLVGRAAAGGEGHDWSVTETFFPET